MNKTTLTAAIALALATASTGALAANKKVEAAPQAAPAATQEEINAVRAQLQALAERLQKLEQSNQDLAKENAELKAQGEKIVTAQADAEKSRDAQSDALAKTATKVAASDWAGRIKWNGDFRYRDESIKREVKTDQVRDRIRARFGFSRRATTIRVRPTRPKVPPAPRWRAARSASTSSTRPGSRWPVRPSPSVASRTRGSAPARAF